MGNGLHRTTRIAPRKMNSMGSALSFDDMLIQKKKKKRMKKIYVQIYKINILMKKKNYSTFSFLNFPQNIGFIWIKFIVCFVV